jgi:hypothetical protein
MEQLQTPDSPSRSQWATNNLESNGVYSAAGINHQRRQRRLRINFPDPPNPISPFLPLAHIRVCVACESESETTLFWFRNKPKKGKQREAHRSHFLASLKSPFVLFLFK